MDRLRGLSARVPLRVTLVVALLLLVTMALGVTGAAATYQLREYLTTRVDAQLHDASEVAVRILNERGVEGLQYSATVGASVSLLMLYTDANGAGAGWLGRPVGSRQAPPELPRLDTATVQRIAKRPFQARPEGGRGHDFRVLVWKLPGGTGAVTVAISLTEVDNTVGQFAFTQTLIGALVLAVLAVVGYLMVQTSLRRLSEVERTAREIAAGDLSRRVPPGHPDTEVGRLAAAFNTMLGEIEQAFRARERSEWEARASEARMRRFAADASHELRTPLTAIRGFAELYRQGGGDPAHIIGRIERHATRMSVLVEDLLLLARLDQQRPVEQRPVDLLALAADAVHDTAATVDDHPVTLQALAAQPPVVLGDEARLRQVVGNLLSNAVSHTPAGTRVTVTVDSRDGMALLAVADTGPGLAPEDAARVFERFFRTDPARSRAVELHGTAQTPAGAQTPAVPASGPATVAAPRPAGGSGLGLSIVQALVRAHGGEVRLRTAPGDGARFEVALPLHSPDAADPAQSSAPSEPADPARPSIEARAVAEPAGS